MDFEFFETNKTTPARTKAAAKQLNARLSQEFTKSIAIVLCECADKKDREGFSIVIDEYPGVINEMNADGDTPLLCAAYAGSEEVTELALKKGADINMTGEGGTTAYMWACEQGHTGVGKLLLEDPKLDVTIKDKNGDTALILSVESENPWLVKSTLEREGVNVEDKDEEGNSARMIADRLGDSVTAKIIQDLIKAHKSYKPDSKPAPEVPTPTTPKRRGRPPKQKPESPK